MQCRCGLQRNNHLLPFSSQDGCQGALKFGLGSLIVTRFVCFFPPKSACIKEDKHSRASSRFDLLGDVAPLGGDTVQVSGNRTHGSSDDCQEFSGFFGGVSCFSPRPREICVSCRVQSCDAALQAQLLLCRQSFSSLSGSFLQSTVLLISSSTRRCRDHGVLVRSVDGGGKVSGGKT